MPIRSIPRVARLAIRLNQILGSQFIARPVRFLGHIRQRGRFAHHASRRPRFPASRRSIRSDKSLRRAPASRARAALQSRSFVVIFRIRFVSRRFRFVPKRFAQILVRAVAKNRYDHAASAPAQPVPGRSARPRKRWRPPKLPPAILPRAPVASPCVCASSVSSHKLRSASEGS